jgi:hypothetical protein
MYELQEMPHKKPAFMSQDKVISSSREKHGKSQVEVTDIVHN